MEREWNIAGVGMSSWERDRAKGDPMLHQRRVGAAGGGGDTCPRSFGSAHQINGGWAGLRGAGDSAQTWVNISCAHTRNSLVPPGLTRTAPAPPGWWGEMVWSHQALPRARLLVQMCLVCSPCPAGLHLGTTCCPLWITQKL